MLKVRLVVASIGLAILLPATSTLFAQAASVAPAAPIPSQILTAKKVFISNAVSGIDPKIWSGGPAQPYNELYAAIKSWGRYELVGDPAAADLVFEQSTEVRDALVPAAQYAELRAFFDKIGGSQAAPVVLIRK